MPKQTSALRRALPWLFLAGVAVLTLYMDVYVARNILDGDASDFLRRGYTIAQSGNPFPTDYYYTTELRLVDSPLIFSIFFHFTDSWTLVRILGTALMQGLYVLSFLFLCRSSRLTWGVSAGSAAFLLLPFSTPYARIVLYHVYYINYLSEAFLIVGLTLRLMECRDRRKGILPGVTLAALWVFVGSNGIRHMMLLGAPMLVFAGVHLLRLLSRYTWRHGRPMGERPLTQTQEFRLAALLAASCVCFAVGYLLYAKVLTRVYSVGKADVLWYYPTKSADDYVRMLNGWLVDIGVRSTYLSRMGRPGLALGAALFSSGYLLWASGASALRRGELAPNLVRGLFVSSLVCSSLLFVFDSLWREYDTYYAPVVALMIPTLAMELPLLRDSAASVARKLMILVTCGCLLFQGAYTVRYLTMDREMDAWKGLFMTDTHLADTSREYATFMLDNGYTHALAPYWHANVMMELTDGALTVSGVDVEPSSEGTLTISQYRWGAPKSAFYKENLPPKLLLFVEEATGLALEQAHPDWYPLHTFTGKTPVRVYEITPEDFR